MARDVPQAAKTFGQLAEEAPEPQVPDDVSEATQGAARETVLRHLKPMRERARMAWRDSDRERCAGADPAPPA